MKAAEITRAETEERARLLAVRSYDVVLDLTCGPDFFRSASVITFDSAQPNAATYADLICQTVHEISLNGRSLDPQQVCADGRIALTGLASHNELRVVADFAYSADGSAMQRSVDSADGRIYLYTMLCPADARRVFACFDQPDLKAAFTFHVTAPADWVVLSNQPAAEPDPAGNGVATWHFPPTPQLSTYLCAIVAGEYHLVRDSHTTPDGQVIPLGLACRASLAQHLDAEDMFGVTGQGLDYYTGLFRGPFPFEKYDQIIVPEFPAGAMENVACVTFSEQYSLFRSKVTDAQYEQRAETILHEMAHMWFGNLVTMRWWEDLWLNESFAEYCGSLSAAEATRFTDAWTTFCSGRKVWGYRQDQQPSTHPVAADVPTLTEAIANFDGISYAKGASILKQLVAYLGRDKFFAGIRAYFAEHGWSNATLSDLLNSLSASSGIPLTDWSKAWLETAGPNTLRADYAVDSAGAFTDFTVLQEAQAAHPTLRPHHIAIGLYNRSDDGLLLRTRRVEVDVADSRTEVPDLVGEAQPDLVLLNDDDLGYALIRFDEHSLGTLTTSIGEFADPLARTLCWSAVLDMATQGEITLPMLVDIVAAGVGSEQSASVLESIVDTTINLLVTQADPGWLPIGHERLAATAADLLGSETPGTDRQLAWAQLLGRTAQTSEQLDLVAGLLDGRTEVPGLVIDTEMRWTLLYRLAIAGRAGEDVIAAELERDATDNGRRHALACRAALGDPEHKLAAWTLLTESEDLGFETGVQVGRGFNRPEHAEVLAPYAARYFAELPAIWVNHEAMFRMVLGKLLFPYSAASPELLQQIDEFLATGDHDPGLVRVVIEGRDIVDKALRARALTPSI